MVRNVIIIITSQLTSLIEKGVFMWVNELVLIINHYLNKKKISTLKKTTFKKAITGHTCFSYSDMKTHSF